MADTSSYTPPSRPFLQPPSPNAIPSAEEVGLTGADAWAYGVSTRLMSDPGRWDLFNQVQAGMVWLDEYMKEIEDRLKSGDDDEEVDFVELVKTPGRNRTHPQSHFHNVANAEKLAKINARHFGEAEPLSKATSLERAQVKTKQTLVTTETQSLEKPQQPKVPAVLPTSSTNKTIRPDRDPKEEDLHVVSHPPATPTPILMPETLYNSTTTVTAQTSHTNTYSNHSTASISSASGTSRASVAGGTERRFGPRPLPTVPPSGTRSRAASNVSMMAPTPLMSQLPVRPPSRAMNADTAQPTASDPVDHQPTPTPHAVPAPIPAAAVSEASRKQTAPNPLRTPSPPPEVDSDDMEVEVEVPLNDATITLPLNDMATGMKSTATPIFPTASSLSLSRKPSFAPLPNPSPLRKSMRGHAAGASDAGRSNALLSTTPHSRASSAMTSSNNSRNARSSTTTGTGGQRGSGWFKNIGTPGAATPHGKVGAVEKKGVKSFATDEKTALNTAANAAIGAVSTSTVAPVPTHGRGGASNSLKRKSEAMDGVESTTASAQNSASEGRASKAVKKAGKEFAMERDADNIEDEMDAEDAEGPEGDDDNTAERLLKLRGILKSAGVVDPEKVRPRVDSRPESSNEFRPVSKTGTAASTASEKSEKKTISNTAGVVRVSPMKVSELVGAWEEKKDAAGDASPVGKKPTTERKESGFGLPKFLAQGKFGMSGLQGINLMAASTTPPGSPFLRAADTKLEKKGPAAAPKSAGEAVESSKQTTAAANAGKRSQHGSSVVIPSIFKAALSDTTTVKTNIFTAPVPKPASQSTQVPPAQPKGIFTRPPSQQYGTSQQSQSTTDGDTDPLFEPVRNKGKTSTSTFDTMSQPSQEPRGSKGTIQERPIGWETEVDGLTAGWLSKGNDTLGENDARLRSLHAQGVFDEDGDGDDEGQYEEQDESDRAFAEDDDATNHQQVASAEDDESDREEMFIDSQEEEEAEQDFESDQQMEEDYEEVEPTPSAPPVAASSSVGGGILAQVGSLASKAAFGLKSLRMAAAAAEKEKAEKEKRDARIKAVREAALQKKADEENKRKEEADRKRKLEEERRKKEKADTTLNRSVKMAKPPVPSEKKQPELKRMPSKLGLGNSALGASKIGQPSTSKRAPTPTKAPTIKLVGQSNPSSATATLHSAPSSALTSILGAPVNKAGAKVTFQANSSLMMKANPMGTGNGSTSSLVDGKHLQVERVKTQVSTTMDTQTRVSEGGIDESADLPDIKSEYSNSEDEDRPKTYDPPIWAQSPDLRQALEGMRTVNPDSIFGAMPQLRMDEIFPGRRKNKFRARTSSANWAGTDGVTAEEEEEYARRMGFES